MDFVHNIYFQLVSGPCNYCQKRLYRHVLQYKITARRKALLKRFSVQVKRMDFFFVLIQNHPDFFLIIPIIYIDFGIKILGWLPAENIVLIY